MVFFCNSFFSVLVLFCSVWVFFLICWKVNWYILIATEMLMSFVNLQARYRSYVNKYVICKQVQAITLFILLENVNKRGGVIIFLFYFNFYIYLFVVIKKSVCCFSSYDLGFFLNNEFCISLTYDLKNWH